MGINVHCIFLNLIFQLTQKMAQFEADKRAFEQEQQKSNKNAVSVCVFPINLMGKVRS
jgi:hypothetical protein